MNSAALAVVTILLALGAAGGVSYYMAQQAESARDAAGLATESARIAELESQLAAMRDELARKQQPAPVVERRAVEPISQAQIEAAVARWMEKNAAGRGTIAAAAKKAGPKKLDLDGALKRLSEDISNQEFNEIWSELRKSGQVDAMIKKYEQLAADNPSSPDVQCALGVAYCQKLQGMTPGVETGMLAMKADKVFDKALDIDPEHWDSRFVKATALSFWPAMFGKQAEAINQLEILQKQQEGKATQERKFAQTYLMLGNLYSQQGKAEKAKEIWKKGASYFPDSQQLAEKLSK